MFRADVENADDVRFSVKLFRTCLPEKREFCADIEPGNARAKECLENHRSRAGFGSECRCALASACRADHTHRACISGCSQLPSLRTSMRCLGLLHPSFWIGAKAGMQTSLTRCLRCVAILLPGAVDWSTTIIRALSSCGEPNCRAGNWWSL
jgi:Cysteine rich repeat